ncbi:RHS repeat-associated protein [Pseudomonas sp. 2848]|uniref:RHS repeat-associated core domain-containing protein n=1 Tax=Pseudomonas sp. 2848 TaxID=2183926 RepID=UPI000DAED5AD|nr:RHS repeat-associated core domain-containing protein [Pseudomonas sp. 2848]PZW80443.1 RHS repeat-associated protein [Pseudomonas sp. 2848]
MSLYLPMLDRQRSPFGGGNFSRAYTPYGAIPDAGGPATGFCGQLRDRVTGSYPLGNGNRFYSPEIMRFQSPDRLSPFGAGGINAYGYCAGNPVDNWDPSGGSLARVDMVAPGISAGVSGIATVMMARKFISSLKTRAEVRRMKKGSNDPHVLNRKEVSRTRIVEQGVATFSAGATTASNLAAMGGILLAVPLQIGFAAVGAGAFGLDQLASHRETRHRESPLNFMGRSAGTRDNQIIAGQKLANEALQKSETQPALSQADYENRLEMASRAERAETDLYNANLIAQHNVSDLDNFIRAQTH